MSLPTEFLRFPNTWDVLPFTQAVKDATSGNSKIKKGDYLSEGSIPVVDQGQQLYGGFTNDEELISKAELPTIIFGDHTRIFKYIDVPFALGADGAKILEPKVKLDTRFLFHYLKQLKIESAGYSRHFKFLKETYIPLPPLPEQKRIAAILDKADAIRRKRQQAIDLADQYLRSVFLDMFGDPVTNPKGWEPQSLGSLFMIGTGGTPSRKNDNFYGGNIPWVKTTEVNGSDIVTTKEKITDDAVSASNCKIYPKHSIVIAMYGQGKTRGQVGRLMIDAATNQACAIIEPSKEINMEYVYKYLLFSYEALRELGRGGNQPNLNLRIVKDFKILCPPRELQNKFAGICEKVEGTKKKQISFNVESDNQFNALSQQAFAGKL